MVKVARLYRPENPYGHITENQHLPYHDQPGQILNPLHTSVFAVGLEDGMSFEDAARRFGAINEMLDRNHMVKLLCVLDAGTAWYSVESGEPLDADYMRDRRANLILQVNSGEPNNAFCRWYTLLGAHLTRSVLALMGLSHAYGSPPPHRTVTHYPNAVFNGGVMRTQ